MRKEATYYCTAIIETIHGIAHAQKGRFHSENREARYSGEKNKKGF